MIPRARRSGSWLAWGRQGTAAVELALVAPMLLTLVAGIIDFARVYHDEIELSSAVVSPARCREPPPCLRMATAWIRTFTVAPDVASTRAIRPAARRLSTASMLRQC